MPANSPVSLIKVSFLFVLSLFSIFGPVDASAQTQIFEPQREIKLNTVVDGLSQSVSFRRAINGADPLVVTLANDNIAIDNIVVANIQSHPDLGTVNVQVINQTCVEVTPEFAPTDGASNLDGWDPVDFDADGDLDPLLQFDIMATDQDNMMETITVSSIQGSAGFPSPSDCAEAAPVANDDDFTGSNGLAEDSGATLLDVLANDSPQIPASALNITELETSVAESAGAGSFTNNGTTITYTPAANFSGTFTFTYTMAGNTFDSSSPGTVTVEVIAANDAPVAVDDSDVTAVDEPVTVDVLGNDSDPDPNDVITVSDVTQGAMGSVVNNGTDVTYTPDSGFVGIDTFTYTISDGALTDTATVTIDVGGVNSPPTAVDDSATTNQDVAVVIDVLANDSDIDMDTLTVSDVTDGASGTVTNNGTDVTYTPNAGTFGTDTFTYTVTDGALTDTATVTVTVQQANNVPVPQDDTVTTAQDTPVDINVLGNDSDPDGDALTVVGVSQAANGTVTNNTTSVTYSPDAGFFGDDTFTYDVSDGEFTATATVTVTVEQQFLLESIAETPNQESVARNVDNVCPRLGELSGSLDPGQQDLLGKCTDLINNEEDPDAQRQALDEWSGREIASQQTTGIDFTQVQLTNVSARMQALRQGARGASLAGLQLYHEGEYIPAAQFAAMVKDLAGGGSGDEDAGQPLQSRWGFFGRGKINVGDKDQTDNEAGFDFDAWGVTLGVDYRVTDNFVLGIAGGFNSGETDFDNDGGEMDSDGTSAHVFGVLYGEHAYLDFVASFGQLDYDSVRNINYTDVNGPVAATATGSTDGDLTAIGISFGYEFNKGGWGFTPNISANTIEVDVDAFSETGANGLDLSFGKQNAESSAVEGGFRVSYTASKSWGVLIPELRVAFVKEFDNDSEVLNVQFLNDPFANDASQPSPGIALITDDPDDSYLRWGLALNGQFKNGFSGFVDYETLSGLDLVTSHEFTFGLRYQRQFR